MTAPMLRDGPKMVVGRCIVWKGKLEELCVKVCKNSTSASENISMVPLWAMEHGVRMTQDTQTAYFTKARLKYSHFSLIFIIEMVIKTRYQ